MGNLASMLFIGLILFALGSLLAGPAGLIILIVWGCIVIGMGINK